jgi:hypothetical protein
MEAVLDAPLLLWYYTELYPRRLSVNFFLNFLYLVLQRSVRPGRNVITLVSLVGSKNNESFRTPHWQPLKWQDEALALLKVLFINLNGGTDENDGKNSHQSDWVGFDPNISWLSIRTEAPELKKSDWNRQMAQFNFTGAVIIQFLWQKISTNPAVNKTTYFYQLW